MTQGANGPSLARPDPRLDLVFGALADPTRRHVVRMLISEGSTSVPALSAQLPITRQAVAKHLATLGEAGLIERAPGSHGREVRYRMRAGALAPAAVWLATADRAWAARLDRLKEIVEGGPELAGHFGEIVEGGAKPS